MEERNNHNLQTRNRKHTNRNFFVDYKDDDVVLLDNMQASINAPATKTDANIFVTCHLGGIEIEVGGTCYEIHEGETFVCPSGVFIRVLSVAPGTEFGAISLTDRIIQSLLNTNIYLWNRAMYVMKEHVISPKEMGLDEQAVKVGWHITEVVRYLLTNKENTFRKEMIYLMLQMMLLGYCARYKDVATVEGKNPTIEARTPQGQVLFSRFIEMLNNEPVKHKPVHYYAEKLCVSAKYLSHVCKMISGKAASEFIQNAVVGEIMYYLESTTLTVKEISGIMGFPNISFFGKYVKTHLGMSPNKYRK